MGVGPNVKYPVRFTDRGVSTAPYGSVISTLKAVQYTFGFWAHYEIIAARTLQVASLINPAGNPIAPSKASAIAAAADFSTDEIDLLLGKDQNCCVNIILCFLFCSTV